MSNAPAKILQLGADLDGDDQDLEDLWQIVEGVHLEFVPHVDGHGTHQVAGMLANCRSPTFSIWSGVPMHKAFTMCFGMGNKRSTAYDSIALIWKSVV
jgi:hypothetical protein